ncbi:MAG TPA: TadE/TadG family type IV pilus assembly protein [Pusillimonas sp.]|uniref:TadE/TadG family type IV pilus assembly protein n=1 Tax=Pusillimonas sp. TaxID=3040095 RepID=UPI002D03986A|nr:TadE/TadG family type IV pilus assembly protein [Pusillimonas sp.]HUH88312.1 TadE/TadG family type IV pilus assembly protein [Pusillimonas sp.]
MLRRLSTPGGRQLGTSAVEFTLVAIPLLLAGLGAVELSHWFFVRQAISLALLEAGRAGITDHARPASIEAAFERGLLPLFPATSRQTALQRLQQVFERRHAATGTVPWQIRLETPNTAVFLDFASVGLGVSGAEGLPAINNSYQAEQHEQYLSKGLPQGRGAASGATIFEANNLVMHLSYMHEPLVPGVSALLQLLSAGSSGYARQALRGGHLPLRQTLQLTMQSHPVAWPGRNAKVVAADLLEPHTGAPAANMDYCSGLWCPGGRPETAISLGPAASSGNHPAHAATPDQPLPTHPPAGAADTPGLPEADDALCGTVLCCGPV